MAEPPTILFLDHTAVLGGAELSLRDVAAHFKERAHVVLLSDGPLRPLLEEVGVAVTVVEASASLGRARRDSGVLAALRAGPALVKLLGRLWPLAREADLIYANSQKAFVIGACLNILARRPMIWHLRDMLEPVHFSWLNRMVTTRLANLAGPRVVANSEATRRSLIRAGGRAEQIVTIHNGISPAAYDAVSDTRTARRRADYGFTESDLVVGAFSRLAPWKGQHVLVEALSQLPENVHALLVGDALFGEHDYREQIEQRARDLGVESRVHLLGFRSDVPELIKCCDIIAHTSVAPEPFGRVIVEGMLARRPVIASNGGGAPEIISDQTHGLLVPPADSAALAQAITRLSRDPQLRHSMAAAGRARAESAFSVEELCRKLEREVEALLGTPVGPVATAQPQGR